MDQSIQQILYFFKNSGTGTLTQPNAQLAKCEIGERTLHNITTVGCVGRHNVRYAEGSLPVVLLSL